MMAISSSRRWVCLIAVALPFAVVGCGKGDGYTGPRGSVSGVLTLDGKPLPSRCSVVFIEELHGYLATGIVGDGGKYTLFFRKSRDLPVGNYKVQLSPPLTDTPQEKIEPSKVGIQPRSEWSLPFHKRYLSTSNSGLTFTVALGENTADFQLAQ